MQTNTYFSRGKLLLSGEYLVMEEALALALPLKAGQEMKVTSGLPGKSGIKWQTLVREKHWFSAEYDENLKIVVTNNHDKAFFIQQLLQKAFSLAELKFPLTNQLQIDCSIGFSPEWGFGSSSSLISNLAQWLNIDPYTLLWKTSVGSGYDIACASANRPILYQLVKNKPIVTEVDFRPPFAGNIWFVYLGKKQHSASSLAKYRIKIANQADNVKRISELTNLMLGAKLLADFGAYITEHESIIASILGETPVKQQFFADFPGAVKSLGAWGGDFCMVTFDGTKSAVEKYFKAKKLLPVFGFEEIVV